MGRFLIGAGITVVTLTGVMLAVLGYTTTRNTPSGLIHAVMLLGVMVAVAGAGLVAAGVYRLTRT